MTDQEPHFRTPEGVRKPDLVCVRGERACVIDAQVVSGVPPLNDSHERKVAYYSRNRALVAQIASKSGVAEDQVAFSSCTLSWRGVWASRSAEFLMEMGLSSALLAGITTRVLQGSHTNWSRWCRMTSRGSPPPWNRRGEG